MRILKHQEKGLIAWIGTIAQFEFIRARVSLMESADVAKHMKKAEEWLAFALPEAEAMQDTMEKAWEHMTLIPQQAVLDPPPKYEVRIRVRVGLVQTGEWKMLVGGNLPSSTTAQIRVTTGTQGVAVGFMFSSKTEGDNFVMNLEAMENTGRLVRIA